MQQRLFKVVYGLLQSCFSVATDNQDFLATLLKSSKDKQLAKVKQYVRYNPASLVALVWQLIKDCLAQMVLDSQGIDEGVKKLIAEVLALQTSGKKPTQENIGAVQERLVDLIRNDYTSQSEISVSREVSTLKRTESEPELPPAFENSSRWSLHSFAALMSGSHSPGNRLRTSALSSSSLGSPTGRMSQPISTTASQALKGSSLELTTLSQQPNNLSSDLV